MKAKFISQAAAKGHRKTSWKKMERLGNLHMPLISRSCYAWIAYQTAYLKITLLNI
jgi:DNA polymerase III alpha subunit